MKEKNWLKDHRIFPEEMLEVKELDIKSIVAIFIYSNFKSYDD